ncbi:MAG: PhnD/SsuA/transferrin family substrate-binding protein [Cyanobacteria bacterium P01_D01_bin.128]
MDSQLTKPYFYSFYHGFRFIALAIYLIGFGIVSPPSAAAKINRSSQVAAQAKTLEVAQLVENQNTDVAPTQDKIVKVGVLSPWGPKETKQRWQPTLDYLSEQVPDHKFEFVSLNFENYETQVAERKVDFVLINSGLYVELEGGYGARRIATLRNLRLGEPYAEYGAVIFAQVEPGQPRTLDLQTLKGKSFARLPDSSFASWMITWHTLEQNGITPNRDLGEMTVFETFEDVVYAVQDGRAEAGAVRTDALERMARAGQINLEEFAIYNAQSQSTQGFPFLRSTDLYPEWPFATLAHTPVDLAESVSVALLDLPPEHPATQAGRYHSWTIPANYQPVHELFRDLKVSPYEGWGEVTLTQAMYQHRFWLMFVGVCIGGLTYVSVRSAERQRTATQLLQVNSDLEERVEERTKELQTAKEHADTANRAKSEFLANMSHELRTPLNGILGYAQILQRSKSIGHQEQQKVSIIAQCGNHLLTLINDILDLSKIEARKLELVVNAFHFPSFLQGVAEICRIRAEQKGISLIYKVDSNLPSGIKADEKRLRQVLINLLGNAIKFTNDGQVTFLVQVLSVEPSPNRSDQGSTYTLRFSVKDTGIGITPEQLSKIFLPFEQVGNLKKQSEGTGLGLAISQKILALMDSQIEIQSEVDQGSNFWFDITLPEAKEWATISRRLIEGVVVGYQGQQRTVLVVDDRWENRSVIVSLLKPLNFRVIEASNGQEGWDMAIAHTPDAIISDLMMPVMDGYQLLQKLRASETLKEVAAIASSASVFESNQHEAIDAGADVFLPKPIRTDELLQQLQQLLKLDWIYEESNLVSTPLPISDTNLDAASELILPTQDVLEQLHTLIQDGDTQGVLELVEPMSTENANLAPFAQQVTQLVSRFQLKTLQTLIERYLD